MDFYTQQIHIEAEGEKRVFEGIFVSIYPSKSSFPDDY